MSTTAAKVPSAMAESSATSQPAHSSAPSYLVAGVLFYGLVGWLLDQWLGTRFLVAAGVLVGAALGTYMMILQLQRHTAAEQARQQHGTTKTSKQTRNEESE